ncbi:PucR family transcriptional regulator ligand-binding domain-containing protein [Kitasatospora sp. NPDC089797]|uniref:PucR family transcriptional regulator n=1 Tax=Kitasatospora sp. NPDC089797 TaxID=3155298 RepID=UPI00343B7985
MPVTLRDLLREEGLGLRLCTDTAAVERVVRWVAVTELADPTEWMTGGELLLTTGLRQRTADTQTAFVRRVAAAGASGIGFGTGLSHPTVPRATVAEAERLGLAVLEVPYETPFIAVNRLVAERVTAEDHSAQRRLVDQHDLLVQALSSGEGLTALLRVLRRVCGSEVAVVDRHGVVLAAVPERSVLLRALRPGEPAGGDREAGEREADARGPGERGAGERGAGAWRPGEQGAGGRPVGAAPDRAGPLRLPVRVDGTTVAFLCLRPDGTAPDRTAADGTAPDRTAPDALPEVLPYAVRLVGLELARRQAYLAGRRELVGQVVEDVVRDVIAPATAERRLAAFGLDVRSAHRVVLGRPAPPDGPPEERAGGGRPDGGPAADQRLARLCWQAAGGPDSPEPVLTAVVDRYLVAVLPQSAPVEEPARRFGAALSGPNARAAVGVGGCYRGVDGLRRSWFEAQAALTKGPGVHGGDPLNLSRLLLSAPDLPLKELAAEVLRPLTGFDRANRADLVATLHAYLAADCSVQAVAERLYVHRNTVRYRLDQIERLTGRSLQSLQDRFQLWLALLAVYPERQPALPHAD